MVQERTAEGSSGEAGITERGMEADGGVSFILAAAAVFGPPPQFAALSAFPPNDDRY